MTLFMSITNNFVWIGIKKLCTLDYHCQQHQQQEKIHVVAFFLKEIVHVPVSTAIFLLILLDGIVQIRDAFGNICPF